MSGDRAEARRLRNLVNRAAPQLGHQYYQSKIASMEESSTRDWWKQMKKLMDMLQFRVSNVDVYSYIHLENIYINTQLVVLLCVVQNDNKTNLVLFSGNVSRESLIHTDTVAPDTNALELHHFHLHHGDFVRIELTATNKAELTVSGTSDGLTVDLTEPIMLRLVDGDHLSRDLQFTVIIKTIIILIIIFFIKTIFFVTVHEMICSSRWVKINNIIIINNNNFM